MLDEEVLDIAAACVNRDNKPEITLYVNSQPVVFLCDTGACRTVLRNNLDIRKSKQKVFVRSANGTVQDQSLSVPISIKDPVSGNKAFGPVILSPSCPFNLLGRDFLVWLNISIRPTPDGGMEACREPTRDVLVLKGPGEPNYWWSLDICQDPLKTPQKLIEVAREHVKQNSDVMKPDSLHVTLRFKRTPGPDHSYDKEVHKLGPQKVVLTDFCWNNKGNSFCLVTLTPAATKVKADFDPPHVSLTKLCNLQWKDLGMEAAKVAGVTRWETENGIWTSSYTDYKKIKLNWVVTTTPTVHLFDQTK